jgi:hypothetical protein
MWAMSAVYLIIGDLWDRDMALVGGLCGRDCWRLPCGGGRLAAHGGMLRATCAAEAAANCVCKYGVSDCRKLSAVTGGKFQTEEAERLGQFRACYVYMFTDHIHTLRGSMAASTADLQQR